MTPQTTSATPPATRDPLAATISVGDHSGAGRPSHAVPVGVGTGVVATAGWTAGSADDAGSAVSTGPVRSTKYTATIGASSPETAPMMPAPRRRIGVLVLPAPHTCAARRVITNSRIQAPRMNSPGVTNGASDPATNAAHAFPSAFASGSGTGVGEGAGASAACCSTIAL